jgi:short-subunit dehydrogenase
VTGSILLFGGRSEIGLAVTTRLAAGHDVVLAARRADDLDEEEAALLSAGAAGVTCIEFDADDTDSHPALIGELFARGPVEAAVVAFGILGDAARAEADVDHALQIARVDYLAQISVITLLAGAMREQGRGTIIVFSSIAGQRVRRANYVYGSTKAGLDGFASGLSDALHGSGVRLLLVRPGFVIGAMTKELMAGGVKPAPMSKTADQVADAVVRAYRRGKAVVWVPWALAPVTLVFRLLPRAIWRRMPR